MVNCGGSNMPDLNQTNFDNQVIMDYLSTNSITAIKHNSGLYYEMISENPSGKSQQIYGNILSIYYHIKVLESNDIEIISASAGDSPTKMKQGVGAIYPTGLDIGLALMKEGETFKFYIPSKLAYDKLSFSSVIPANAIIEIEVELVKIQNEVTILAEENTLINDYITANALNDIVANPLNRVKKLATGEYYKKIIAGTMNNVPVKGETISIQYTGVFLNNVQFDATGGTSFSYTFGTDILIQGFNNGIAQMEKGERALLIIPSQLAYKESIMFIPSFLGVEFAKQQIIPTYAIHIAPYKVLVFDVTLLN